MARFSALRFAFMSEAEQVQLLREILEKDPRAKAKPSPPTFHGIIRTWLIKRVRGTDRVAIDLLTEEAAAWFADDAHSRGLTFPKTLTVLVAEVAWSLWAPEKEGVTFVVFGGAVWRLTALRERLHARTFDWQDPRHHPWMTGSDPRPS